MDYSILMAWLDPQKPVTTTKATEDRYRTVSRKHGGGGGDSFWAR
jgi:hypothetical protein